MKMTWSCHPGQCPRPDRVRRAVWPAHALAAASVWASCCGASFAASAPDWVREAAAQATPEHEPDTNALILLADTTVTVQANGKERRLERRVFRILRPQGAQRAADRVDFDSATSRILNFRGWCITPDGRVYDASGRDAAESALPDVLNGYLMGEYRSRMLRVPAAVPGSVVAFEIEEELQPDAPIDEWEFQDTIPVREARYTLELPAGWQFTPTWINYPSSAAVPSGANRWRWEVGNVGAIRVEPQMPPPRAEAARLMVAWVPTGAQRAAFRSWRDIGEWYLHLARSQLAATTPIDNEVAMLAPSTSTTLAKMQALARFVQSDIRYVAIELGIGRYQPHAAADVFTRRYGDCKDKATLLSAMLKQAGLESYYVLVNTARGAITQSTPPNLEFDHVILAISLPRDVDESSLRAIADVPVLGRLLYFDPTDSYTPFGSIRGPLQGAYGLVAGPAGGTLVALPRTPEPSAGITRTARLSLDANGALTGEVHEIWSGDRAATQRGRLDAMATAVDLIKPVESDLAGSLSNFQILKATVGNRSVIGSPLEWTYTIDVQHYAKSTGNLLIVRPRVIGVWSSALLETDKPRQHPIEFDELERNVEEFDIVLPEGFVADDLPPPVDADFGFAAYHSKTEISGGTLRYRRSLEIKQLSLPLARAADLKRFYRIIDTDERTAAVLEKKGA